MAQHSNIITQTPQSSLRISDYELSTRKNLNEISIDKKGNKKYMESAYERTSNLMSPIMLLSGHTGEVFSCRFHPAGNCLATAGHDRNILVWSTFADCENICVMRGHKAAVTELCFTHDGERMITSSIDRTVGLWDFETGTRIRKFKGHTNYVNACNVSSQAINLACSASDDGSIKIWDLRTKQMINSLENTYANLACCFTDIGDKVISGGIDNDIKIWDFRASKICLVIRGHLDSITSLRLSRDGSYLISNSMDNSICMWDIYPFCSGERCMKKFFGHSHTFEKNLLRCCFSPDNKLIASGSGDSFLYIWNSISRSILYKLPGHDGSVNDVDFHPSEPIIASCGNDKTIYIGEINA